MSTNSSNSGPAYFFGRITASATHEFRNVLAIIRENAGLLEDLLNIAKTLPDDQRARMNKTLALIQKQIERGVAISDRLNRFSHSPDTASTLTDINETAAEMCTLMNRIAQQKRITLDPAGQGKNTCELTCDPLGLRMTLCAAVDYLLSLAPERSSIEISARPEGNSGIVCFRIVSQDTDASEKLDGSGDAALWRKLEETAKGMAADASMSPDGRMLEVRVGR